MSWVAWKQRHLWSGAPRTTCYSNGWSTYYYNCRCWAKTWLCWVILEYFHQSDQKKTMCFNCSRSRTPVYIVSCESQYTGFAVSIRIVVTKYRCIAMHRWIVTPLYPTNIVFVWLTSIKSISHLQHQLISNCTSLFVKSQENVYHCNACMPTLLTAIKIKWTVQKLTFENRIKSGTTWEPFLLKSFKNWQTLNIRHVWLHSNWVRYPVVLPQ